MRLPLASSADTPLPSRTADTTVSPSRSVTPRRLSWYSRLSTIFFVSELQHVRPLIDDGDARIERRRHRRELEADHTRADDHQVPRDLLQAPQPIDIQDALVVDRARAGHGPAASRRQSESALPKAPASPPGCGHVDACGGVRNVAQPVDDVDTIAPQMILHNRLFPLDHRS